MTTDMRDNEHILLPVFLPRTSVSADQLLSSEPDFGLAARRMP